MQPKGGRFTSLLGIGKERELNSFFFLFCRDVRHPWPVDQKKRKGSAALVTHWSHRKVRKAQCAAFFFFFKCCPSGVFFCVCVFVCLGMCAAEHLLFLLLLLNDIALLSFRLYNFPGPYSLPPPLFFFLLSLPAF